MLGGRHTKSRGRIYTGEPRSYDSAIYSVLCRPYLPKPIYRFRCQPSLNIPFKASYTNSFKRILRGPHIYPFHTVADMAARVALV